MREVITLPEVAKMLGINPETARRWAVGGKIPVFRYNGKGRWRAFRDEIDKFLSAQQNGSSTGQVGSA
jgi:excisionase family DNA binding protein